MLFYRAAIGGERTQFEVQVVQGKGAMVDDHLIDHALLVNLSVIAAKGCNEPAITFFHGIDPVGDGEGDLQVLQAAHVGHQVHGHDFRCKRAVRGDDFDSRTALRDDLGSLQGGMIPSIVEDQYVATGLDVTGNDVPG
ncbi:hypothetical protein D3C79_835030 [compost metagenome]